jgi:zinc/manganese transport system permease protein
MRWALVCSLVLAGIHAYLGFHVVRRGVLFVDLAMAQMAALGAAVGVVLGMEHGTVGEYALSCAFALGAAATFAVVRSRRVPQEAVVAICYGLAMAATFVVLEHSPHGMEEVKHLLVGQVLTVAPGKVLLTAGLYAVLGLVLARFHRRIIAVTESPADARDPIADFVFYGVFALVVTSSVGLVGVLLVFALLVMPSVAALLLSRGTNAALGWGWSLASAGALAGLHAAFHLDLPAAPVIVIALAVPVVAAALARRGTED